jgi:hypothetical protein
MLDLQCGRRVLAVDTVQIQALQEAKLAFERVVAIFRAADSADDADKCRTRAALTLITLGLGELRDIWSERRVRTAIKRLLDRLYQASAKRE